jgi:hypothetical protein
MSIRFALFSVQLSITYFECDYRYRKVYIDRPPLVITLLWSLDLSETSRLSVFIMHLTFSGS